MIRAGKPISACKSRSDSLDCRKLTFSKKYDKFENPAGGLAIEIEMTSFTPTSILNAADVIPGGMIRQGEGFGLGTFACIDSQAARTEGKTRLTSSTVANSGAGRLRSRRSTEDLDEVTTAALRGTTFAQAGGPVGVSSRGFSWMAFDEVVFSRRPVPGGSVL
jgi:hypothetical protein